MVCLWTWETCLGMWGLSPCKWDHLGLSAMFPSRGSTNPVGPPSFLQGCCFLIGLRQLGGMWGAESAVWCGNHHHLLQPPKSLHTTMDSTLHHWAQTSEGSGPRSHHDLEAERKQRPGGLKPGVGTVCCGSLGLTGPDSKLAVLGSLDKGEATSLHTQTAENWVIS